MKSFLAVPRVFHNKKFLYFYLGQSISLMGTRMHIIAFNWLLYQLTGSAFMLGLINFISLLPAAPLTILFGTISQRVSKKRIMLIMEVALVIQTTILFWLVWQERLTLVAVTILRLGIGLAAAIEEPIRMTFFYDIVGPENISEAVATYSSSSSLMRVIGPALAGFIIAWKGEAFIFLVNAVTFLPNIFLLTWFSYVRPMKLERIPESQVNRPVKIGLKQGANYLLSKHVSGLLILSAIVSLFYLPYITHMPVFVEEILGKGADTLGVMMGAIGVGAAVGALVISAVENTHHSRLFNISLLLIPVSLIGFSLSDSLIVNTMTIILVSANVTIVNALLNSTLQTQSTEEYRGLVMSVFVLLRNGLLRVGALLVGGLAEFSGISNAFIIFAVLGFGVQSFSILIGRSQWLPRKSNEST